MSLLGSSKSNQGYGSGSELSASTSILTSFIVVVYQEGDIVKQPMKKGSFVPKNVPGVGWGGWGGVWWVMHWWGGVGHAWVGGDGVGHVGVGWVIVE